MGLHTSGEDYLEAVLVLQKEKGMVRSVDVARYTPTATATASSAKMSWRSDSPKNRLS